MLVYPRNHLHYESHSRISLWSVELSFHNLVVRGWRKSTAGLSSAHIELLRLPRALAPDGKFRQVVLLGIDDASLVGAPRKMLLGRYVDLKDPDAVIIDRAGYAYSSPAGRSRSARPSSSTTTARLVGIAEASAPFATFPGVLHALHPGPPLRGSRAQPALLCAGQGGRTRDRGRRAHPSTDRPLRQADGGRLNRSDRLRREQAFDRGVEIRLGVVVSERKAKRDSAEVPGQARHRPHRSVIADGRLDSGALERPRDFERISTAKVEREDPDARSTIDGALAIRHNPWHLGQPGVSVLGKLGLPSGDRAQRGAQGVPAGGSAFCGGGPRGAAEIRPRGAAESVRYASAPSQPA